MSSYEILTPGRVEQFKRDGYLVIPKFLSDEQVNGLLKRSKELLQEFDLEDHPMTRFTTGEENDEKKHVGDDYFLTSGDKIRFFFEVDAFGPDGKLNRPKGLSVNKMGHALHELDPAFRAVTLQNDQLKKIARDLNFHKDPAVLQSMVIFKQPSIGGEVSEHNDSTFLYSDPPSALGFWFALEKCTAENGALGFVPGSHLTIPITKRFVRLPKGGTGFEQLRDLYQLPSKGDYKLVTCDAGDLLLIHGSVMHKSEKNLSLKTRYAYTFHMIESAPHAKWDEKNWLQPTSSMPFSKLFSASSDASS
ncbi:uncharacterized protein EI90DRAFT_3152782 [Cantharellus anzutake]|uniref:uncharacterized protein n=1 Tax=Cantharellus anzutake TaxID=1750568 RepID=UPI001904F6F3|nr:uncharacterized protein EI90DRAFT_3152782 [Cantharellus anzutake]KAF8335746.1 hypothetical protein EI90DRAFT_3152782 [Cantharellus anzutake]